MGFNLFSTFYYTSDSNLNNYSTKSAMHYLLATNNSMYKIGKKETNLSPFCENVEETEYHLNWDCPKIQQLLA